MFNRKPKLPIGFYHHHKGKNCVQDSALGLMWSENIPMHIDGNHCLLALWWTSKFGGDVCPPRVPTIKVHCQTTSPLKDRRSVSHASKLRPLASPVPFAPPPACHASRGWRGAVLLNEAKLGKSGWRFLKSRSFQLRICFIQEGVRNYA